MKLQLLTLLGTKLSEDVYEVQVPTATGPIAIFPHHQPLVTLLTTGVISVRRKKDDANADMEVFATYGGVAEITGDSVKILVDEADHSDEIAEDIAIEALRKAEEMRENAKDSVELDKAQMMIDRYATRIKVAGLRRRNRR